MCCRLPLSDPRWASVNRGVLICDECCSVHRSLGRHSSQVRHLRHTPWPPTQLQVHAVVSRCAGFAEVQPYREQPARFPYIPSPDGADVIQQRSQLHMGALASGPGVSDERQTEGQPSGQAAVSGRRRGAWGGGGSVGVTERFPLSFPIVPQSPNKSEFIKAKYQMLAFVHRMPCREDDSLTANDLSKVWRHVPASQLAELNVYGSSFVSLSNSTRVFAPATWRRV